MLTPIELAPAPAVDIGEEESGARCVGDEDVSAAKAMGDSPQPDVRVEETVPSRTSRGQLQMEIIWEADGERRLPSPVPRV